MGWSQLQSSRGCMYEPARAILPNPHVIAGDHRRGERAEVRPVQPDVRSHRIGAHLHREVETAARRLGRALQAVALRVVEPAVVGASDAALFDPAVEQRCAAVSTVVLNQTDVPALVLEEHQVLAQDADELGRTLLREVPHRRNRHPIAPQSECPSIPGPTR